MTFFHSSQPKESARIRQLLLPAAMSQADAASPSGAARVPYDILELIVCLAPETALPNLCLVSHDLDALAVRLLYRDLHFDSSSVKHAVQCLQSIRSSPHLGRLVWSLKLDYRLHQFPYPTEAPALVASTLRCTPNLRRLDIAHLAQLIALSRGFADTIAHLDHLSDLNVAWGPVLDPLLCRIGPLKRLEFDVGSGVLDENNDALEHLLRVSVYSLEELRLTGYKLAAYLSQHPDLIFERVTSLELHYCEPLGLEIARAFPSCRRVQFFPVPFTPPELLSDPANFPLLEHAEAGVDEYGYAPPRHAKLRPMPHITLYNSSHIISEAAIMSAMACIEPDSVVSFQMQSLETPNILSTLEKGLRVCTRLQFLCISIKVDAEGTQLREMVCMLLRAAPATLRFVSISCATKKTTRAVIEQLADLVAGYADALLARIPSLRLIELRSGTFSGEHMVHLKLEKWDGGALRWFRVCGQDLKPPAEFAFRR
ncbi:hypothetical protein EXIGLDRAFT_748244 [Exidia glandulosa HHB12029]|uniref:F-box domain-containing protein n=1 Tax=Exidia glandulosa HHB12029 TaxID=1314781 RepID=A0A165JQI5_EXIGL|nr:hypothetical protein EXIGLDRAFT_748244 [Exidia glandulosa HHB12029]